MRSAIPVQERPARNVLTVGLSCANHTRKPVTRVARSSALFFLPSSAAHKACLNAPRERSGAEKSLIAKLRLLQQDGELPVESCS